MRKKTLRTRIICALLSLVFLVSILNVQLPAEAKATTQTIPISVGGQTYNVTPGQWVTVNTPGGQTSYNVRFVDGKPVALEMSQYQQILFGEAATTGTTTGKTTTTSSNSAKTTTATTNNNNSGTMTWNEFQKANAGKGMSSSEMSAAYNDYKAGNTSGKTTTNTGKTSTNTTTNTGKTSTNTNSNTSQSVNIDTNNSGTMSWNEFQKANAGKGMSSSEMSAAYKDYKAGNTTTNSNVSQKSTNYPKDPQTGKMISHEEAIARNLPDHTTTSDKMTWNEFQKANAGKGMNSTEMSEAYKAYKAEQGGTTSTETAQSSGGKNNQVAQTSDNAAQSGSEGKNKTTIGDKAKSGYQTGKNLTNQGFQNVKDSLKSGFSAKNILVTAGITVGVDLATSIMRGEQPSLKKALKTVCCAEFVGGVAGSTLGAAAGSFFTPFLSCIPVVGGALGALAPAFGSVVGSSVGAYVAGDLKNGRFSIKEAFKRIDWVGVTGQAIGSTVGAALGSCLGPVGTVLGGMVGGYFGNWAAHKIAGLFGKGEANLPQVAMPTGTVTAKGSTINKVLSLGGDNVTSVTITDDVTTTNNNNTEEEVVVSQQEVVQVSASDNITDAYNEYNKYLTQYNNLIMSGKTQEAIEIAEKMNEAKAKYDALRGAN